RGARPASSMAGTRWRAKWIVQPRDRTNDAFPSPGGRERAGVTRASTLSTAVETLPPPVIHLYIQPSSGQRMHRSTERSSPAVVDARHAAALQNRDGLRRRLGGTRAARGPGSP